MTRYPGTGGEIGNFLLRAPARGVTENASCTRVHEGERLLSTREVADLLGLSPASVLRRWRAGELPGYRLASNVLRLRADELELWLEARRGVESGSPVTTAR